MKRFENLYAGIVGRKLVGGIDLDKVNQQFLYLSQLDICTANGIVVGFVSLDALRLALMERKDEKAEK